MAYERKPGQGAMFKNSGKKADNHPDYTGTYKHHDGSEWQIAGWVKDGKKGKFLSISTSVPREKRSDVAATSNDDWL